MIVLDNKWIILWIDQKSNKSDQITNRLDNKQMKEQIDDIKNWWDNKLMR